MPLAVGERAPAFRLRGTDNAYWILGEPDKRRSVLLVFMRREVSSCRLLLPFVERLHRRGRSREVEILGITLDTVPDTLEFADGFSLTFPILIEETGLETVQTYRIDRLPTLFLLDRDLVVRDSMVGWSRESFERIAGTFLEQAGAADRTVWEPSDIVPDSEPAMPIAERMGRIA